MLEVLAKNVWFDLSRVLANKTYTYNPSICNNFTNFKQLFCRTSFLEFRIKTCNTTKDFICITYKYYSFHYIYGLYFVA